MIMIRYIVFMITSIKSIASLTIYPTSPELTLMANASLTLSCIDDGPVRWMYPNSTPKFVENKIENGTYSSNLTMSNPDYLDTGYFTCQSDTNADEKSEIYVYVFDGENLIAMKDDVEIIHANANDDVLIPCKPTKPDVNLTLIPIDTDNISNFKYDAKFGFTLHKVEVSNSGILSCDATYEDDTSSDSRSIQILVNPSAEVILTPYIDATGSYHLVEGDNATLNCSVNAPIGGKVTLQWMLFNDNAKNKSVIEDIKEVLHDKHKLLYRMLTIYNLTKKDQGPYTCNATNDNLNSAHTTHILEIHDLNSTFLQVEVQGGKREFTVEAGNPQIKWIVNVTAYPRPAIIWFDTEGREITSGLSLNGKYVVHNDGHITKLEINNINIGDSGSYQMKAFNGYQSRVIDFLLNVEDKPAVELKNDADFYMFGSTYQIKCFLSAYPLPRVVWSAQLCNNCTKCDDSSFESIPGNHTKETAIKDYVMESSYDFVADDTKCFRCEATNSRGSSNSTSLFIVSDVEGGFDISHNIDIVAVGDDVEMTCRASKYFYHDSIMWYRNTSDGMVPVKNLGIQLHNSSSKFSYASKMLIRDVQKRYSGDYVCQAMYRHPSLHKYANKTKFLNIHDPEKPLIEKTNLNGTTWPLTTGRKLKLEAYVTGIPQPTVIWYKNGQPLQIKQSDRLILGKRNETLDFQHLALADEGVYSWFAYNKAGNVTANFTLMFTDKTKSEIHEHKGYIVAFLILTVFLGLWIVWAVIRIRKEKKLRKELTEAGLLNFEEGAPDSLNPELGIEDQADLLPYDKKWEFPREKLKFGKQLGSGAFGVVMKAEADGIIDENVPTTVAVKMVKRNADPLYIRALASELKIMIHLGRHLNVVNLLGACTKDINKRELVVIVEYCKYGNLRDFLLKQRMNFIDQIENGKLDLTISEAKRNQYYTAMNGGRMDSSGHQDTVSSEETPIGSDGYLINKDNEPEWRSVYRGDYRNATVKPIRTADLICWSFQIARGMEYLASRKVLHGDLAARNVLLADDNVVKICDFGLAKSMYSNENYQRNKNQLLPVKWMAIESIRDRTFSTQSDVWSFGITMWELFSLSVTPYPGVERYESLYSKLVSGYRLEKPAYATNDIYAIMKDCWHSLPALRPTFTDLSERLGLFLEDGLRSQYINLNEVYVKMNEDAGGNVDYLAILNTPDYNNIFQEPRYVNVPTREISDPEDEVELKPMLKKSDDKCDNPKAYSNPNYTALTRTNGPMYVNILST